MLNVLLENRKIEAEGVIRDIKKSAKELFRRFGFNKTSVSTLASHAHVAKATIYKYFGSKDEILHSVLIDYIQDNVQDILTKNVNDTDLQSFLANTILRVSRITYTVCNEFIGWEFIRESANAQEYLKRLSEDLEFLLLRSFLANETITSKVSEDRLTFLIKSSKSIVFSFAFTSVSEADVRKNFISFQKEILPYLVTATLHE